MLPNSRLMKTIYKLARYDVFRLFGMFCIPWLIVNMTFGLVEQIGWGEKFPHFGDLILLWFLAIAFGYTAYHMGVEMVVKLVTDDNP